MQIEAGKYYQTRSGKKVGPIRREVDYEGPYKWTAPDMNGEALLYTDDGRYLFDCECEDDIIAEWPDNNPKPAAPYTSSDAWADIHAALGDAVGNAIQDSDYDKAMEYAGLMRAIEQEGLVSPNNATEH